MNVVTTIFIVVVISAVLVAVLNLKVAPEYFTKSSKFGNINKMILIGPKGDIVLQPVGDIDSSINAVGDGIKEDTETAYQTKAAMAPYMTNAQGRGLLAKTEARADKQDAQIKANKESAVQKGAPYAIKMGEGNSADARNDRYVIGAGGWSLRYNHDGPTAKWLLV